MKVSLGCCSHLNHKRKPVTWEVVRLAGYRSYKTKLIAVK